LLQIGANDPRHWDFAWSINILGHRVVSDPYIVDLSITDLGGTHAKEWRKEFYPDARVEWWLYQPDFSRD